MQIGAPGKSHRSDQGTLPLFRLSTLTFGSLKRGPDPWDKDREVPIGKEVPEI